MGKDEQTSEWNRYEHIGGLMHHLLQHRLAETGFVGLPQGEVALGEIVTAIIGELDYLKVMQQGLGRSVLNGMQGTLNSTPIRFASRLSTIGRLSLHNVQITRKLLVGEVHDTHVHGINQALVTVIGYNASGRVGNFETRQLSFDFAKIDGFGLPNEIVSTVVLMPRNHNVTTSGLIPSDPLDYGVNMLEGLAASLPR